MQKIIYKNNLHNKINLFDIYQNNGATLNTNGDKITYKNGYQVSIKDLYIIDIKNKKQVKNKIIKAIKQANNNFNIGLWIDNNKIYIDYSINIKNKNQAIKKAKELKQKSILQWSTMQCITIKY